MLFHRAAGVLHDVGKLGVADAVADRAEKILREALADAPPWTSS